MWVGFTGGDQISYTPQKQTQPVGSVCRASPESNCSSETNLAAHAGWSKPLPPLSFLPSSIHPPPFLFLSPLPLVSSPLLKHYSLEDTVRQREGGEGGHEKGGKRGFSFSEIMLWISLEQPSVFGLAWRLADDRGRWSWKRVINKHCNRGEVSAGLRPRTFPRLIGAPPGHITRVNSRTPTLYSLCLCVCV